MSESAQNTHDLIVWEPELHSGQGPALARMMQARWGGHVFLSTTKPGFAAWFSFRYTPSRVLTHQAIRGHEGVLNPPLSSPHGVDINPQGVAA